MADTADQLAWEEQQRPRAGVLALASGLLVIGALVIAGVSNQDRPPALLLDSLRNLEKPDLIGGQTTTHIADFTYASSHEGSTLASILLILLGLVGIGLTVTFLGRCTRARRPETPRLALPAAVVGGALLGLSFIVIYISQRAFHDQVLDGPRTVDAVRDRPAAEGVGALMQFAGTLMLALATVLISLNAMRVGLLTKAMGYVGVAVGLFIVLQGPTFPTLPLWIAFLAPLFFGRWIGGQPPAWDSGEAEPWPSGQELREQRMRARGQLAEPDPEPVEERATTKPHPSSKKRKRKRRA